MNNNKKTFFYFYPLSTEIVGRITFDKMTNRDYPGTIYYTIRNVSLYECLGWCRDEVDCTAAAFSFVVNPLTPIQETTCLLQNETLAKKSVSAIGGNNAGGSYSGNSLQKAVNMYFFTKMQLRSDNLCNRLWSFERFPNKMLRGLDNAIIYTSNREACLSACLNEVCYPNVDNDKFNFKYFQRSVSYAVQWNLTI